MYQLVIRYYGELCDKEFKDNEEVYDEEILAVNENRIDLVNEMTKKGIEYIQNGYVIDTEENHKDLARYFLGKQENWNNYVEIEIIESDELEEKIKILANDYDYMSYSDFTGCIMALETEYGIHYQEIYNKIAEIIIKREIKNFDEEKSLNNNKFIEFIKELEKKFECEIDLIDFGIKFLVV